LSRLRERKERREEAFAEICVAFFFAARCELLIFEWGRAGPARRWASF